MIDKFIPVICTHRDGSQIFRNDLLDIDCELDGERAVRRFDLDQHTAPMLPFLRSGRVGCDNKLYAIDGNGGAWIENDSHEMRHMDGLMLVLALFDEKKAEYKEVAETINQMREEAYCASEDNL